VTTEATSANQTPVRRLSATSSAASYSPATWTRRFPSRSGSSTKTAGASKAASNSSHGHAGTAVKTAARTATTSSSSSNPSTDTTAIRHGKGHDAPDRGPARVSVLPTTLLSLHGRRGMFRLSAGRNRT